MTRVERMIREAVGPEATVTSSEILVQLPNGRRQKVQWKTDVDWLVLQTRVACWSDVRDAEAAHRKGDEARILEVLVRQILEWNRHTAVVAFSLTPKHSVQATIAQRVSEMQVEELKLYLQLLAREADRFEAVVVGRDLP